MSVVALANKHNYKHGLWASIENYIYIYKMGHFKSSHLASYVWVANVNVNLTFTVVLMDVCVETSR